MATIIRLSRESTENSKLFGVKRAFSMLICSPLYLALAALLPVAFIVGISMYLPFIAIQRMTGSCPLNLTFRLGESVPADTSDAA